MKTKVTKFNGLYVCLHIPEFWNGKTVLYVHGGPGSHSYDFECGIQSFPQLKNSMFAFITYDQRGSGRSENSSQSLKELSHAINIEDLTYLIKDLPKIFNLDKIDIVFGHSYGARLVYDTLWKHPHINILYLLVGTNIYPNDAFNTSLFLDLQILKNTQPEEYELALKLIVNNNKEPYLLSPKIRKLFNCLSSRQTARQHFYWANPKVQTWWNKINTNSKVHDNDEVYFRIVETFNDEKFNTGNYDPSHLCQFGKYIIGFHDILMNGTTTFPEIKNNIIKCYASSHYPQFEEPEIFINALRSLLHEEQNYTPNYKNVSGNA
ncbi:alpha/beta hydrolase [Pigmentibacter sp. JX0631]|uniref:alpha/beta fold hydrolase n=1 Tax=Pigmentibacter sp. JX0631 TaxID=2976982 RepID=UPI0024685753|nr:alpha/beta hydrolase [Pigmentibacter sp. JX0631]WGL61289.1 alpha/beta hydrolase [Pigmentibacter sp. JX0631]